MTKRGSHILSVYLIDMLSGVKYAKRLIRKMAYFGLNYHSSEIKIGKQVILYHFQIKCLFIHDIQQFFLLHVLTISASINQC